MSNVVLPVALQYQGIQGASDAISARRLLTSFRAGKRIRMSSKHRIGYTDVPLLIPPLSNGNKPYVCGYDDCVVTFGDPSSCARHRKERHRRIEPYRCPEPSCTSR